MIKLITHKLEKISAQALHFDTPILSQLIGRDKGIYILYKKDIIYYVGKAADLKNRIATHQEDHHKNRWDRFSLFIVRNNSHIPELESLLINICEPEGNKAYPKGRAINLKPDFRKLLVSYHMDQEEKMLCEEKAKFKKKKIKNSKNKKLYSLYKNKNMKIVAFYKGKEYKALFLKNGSIRYNKKIYPSPSAAARKIVKRRENGLLFWRLKDKNMMRLKEYLI